jgi:hypothetical protein
MLIPWKTHQLFVIDLKTKVLVKESQIQMQTLKVITEVIRNVLTFAFE